MFYGPIFIGTAMQSQSTTKTMFFHKIHVVLFFLTAKGPKNNTLKVLLTKSLNCRLIVIITNLNQTAKTNTSHSQRFFFFLQQFDCKNTENVYGKYPISKNNIFL